MFRTANADEFNHDRRSDRAAEMLLDFDSFGRIPRHVPALDVGAIESAETGGRLLSLRKTGEFYLLTPYVEGAVYATDLRRAARAIEARPLDVERCESLARWLVQLHVRRANPIAYRRAARDLVGHGEGIFGMIDGYPAGTPCATPERLRAIERRCVEWRWELARHPERCSRIHGDFHPFNVLFEDAGGLEFTLLDTSRGSAGDPADDVTCMAINYVFFALEAPRAWPRGLGVLWRRFWAAYLEGSGDRELLELAPPFLAWRGLVLANPRFYPALSAASRDRLLTFVEQILNVSSFDPACAEGLFA